MAVFTFNEPLNLWDVNWKPYSGGFNSNDRIQRSFLSDQVQYNGEFNWGPTMAMYGTIHEVSHWSGGKLIGHLTDVSVEFDGALESDSDIASGHYLDDMRRFLYGNDTITLSEFDDRVSAFQGNDSLFGMGGNDRLYGSYGSDYSNGGEGSDALVDAIYTRDWDAFYAYRLYQGVLDRDPDPVGHDFWTNALFDGSISNSDAIHGFVSSVEFQSKYGNLDNEQFVRLLYNNILDREPDYPGLAHWVVYLNEGGDRTNVVAGFCDSEEFIANSRVPFLSHSTVARISEFTPELYRLYKATLDREPDAEGLLNWAEWRAYGLSEMEVVDGFVNSVEFKFKYGNTSNKQFVELLYNNVLDREPDPGGYAAWLNALNNGMAREGVVLGFSDSLEFTIKTEDAVADYFRSASASTLSDTLEGGIGDDQLVGGAGADVFIFISGEGGNDAIHDLEPWDWISFEGFGYGDASDVSIHLIQESEGVVFHDQGQTILFHDTELNDLTSDMFLFA